MGHKCCTLNAANEGRPSMGRRRGGGTTPRRHDGRRANRGRSLGSSGERGDPYRRRSSASPSRSSSAKNITNASLGLSSQSTTHNTILAASVSGRFHSIVTPTSGRSPRKQPTTPDGGSNNARRSAQQQHSRSTAGTCSVRLPKSRNDSNTSHNTFVLGSVLTSAGPTPLKPTQRTKTLTIAGGWDGSVGGAFNELSHAACDGPRSVYLDHPPDDGADHHHRSGVGSRGGDDEEEDDSRPTSFVGELPPRHRTPSGGYGIGGDGANRSFADAFGEMPSASLNFAISGTPPMAAQLSQSPKQAGIAAFKTLPAASSSRPRGISPRLPDVLPPRPTRVALSDSEGQKGSGGPRRQEVEKPPITGEGADSSPGKWRRGNESPKASVTEAPCDGTLSKGSSGDAGDGGSTGIFSNPSAPPSIFASPSTGTGSTASQVRNGSRADHVVVLGGGSGNVNADGVHHGGDHHPKSAVGIDRLQAALQIFATGHDVV